MANIMVMKVVNGNSDHGFSGRHGDVRLLKESGSVASGEDHAGGEGLDKHEEVAVRIEYRD